MFIMDFFWRRLGRLLQDFSGTLACAIAFWAFELWGGAPKRVPSLFLLVFAGILALTSCLKFFDENFKETPLSIGVLPSILIFLVSGILIRRGWLGFDIDINQGGLIGEWLLAMVGVQVVLILIYKFVAKIVTG